MKIRNLAFCGVMASILGMGGAYAATDATIIASKAYVDARDNTKQDNSDRFTGTWTQAETAGVDNSTTQYPSMNTLKTVKDGLETSITNNVTNNTYSTNFVSTTNGATNITVTDVQTADEAKLATTGIVESGFNAVHTAIDNMDHATGTASTNASSAVTTVSQADGKVTVTNGTLGIAAIDDAAKEKGNIVVSTAEDNKVPTVGGVQKGILYWQASNNTESKNVYDPTNKIDSEDLARGKDWNNGGETTFTGKAGSAFPKDMDAYIPTVAAVEQRVKKAEADAVAAVPKETNNVLSSNNTGYLPTVAAVQAAKDTGTTASENNGQIAVTAGTNTNDNHVPTSLAVKTDMETLATAINKKLNAKTTAIPAQNNSIVNYDANGLVTGGTLLEDAAGGLKGVNAEAEGNMGCSTSNPCVLTYLGGTGSAAKYRWTAMDTDQLVAQ